MSDREDAIELCEMLGHNWQDMGQGWYECEDCGSWDYDPYEEYETGEVER